MAAPLLRLDAELLARSSDWLVLVQSLAEGFAHGLHRSPFAGSSQEFASYRAFLPGDPIHRIDWKVYGRTDDLFIREFEQETNVRGYLFLDASRSMDFGEGPENKFTYGRLLCAVLAVLLNKQQDAPGLALIGKADQETAAHWLPPSTRNDHLEHLIHALAEAKADGRTDRFDGVDEWVAESHRRSIAAVVTDGLTDLDELKDFLGQLRIRGVEVLLFHLLSPEEVQPSVEGEVVLVDQETGEERAVDGVSYARHHAAHLAAFRADLEQVCHDTETEMCAVTTDQPLDEALQRFMHLRNGAP